MADTTPTDRDQTPETYLGAERAQTLRRRRALATGRTQTSPTRDRPRTTSSRSPAPGPSADESITSGNDAGIELNFVADDVYLDVGGTGTVTATVDGKTTTYPVSGAPNIYPSCTRDRASAAC